MFLWTSTKTNQFQVIGETKFSVFLLLVQNKNWIWLILSKTFYFVVFDNNSSDSRI